VGIPSVQAGTLPGILIEEATNSQVSTFDYLMPLVFETSSMKYAFFWRLFLNNMFCKFFHFS